MKIHTPGHKYELDWFEPQTLSNTVFERGTIKPDGTIEAEGQIIQFIEKVSANNGVAGELKTIKNGTTNEEVLAVLIDRLEFLNNKFRCMENENAIDNLRGALMWLNRRTQLRKERDVEGKALA